MNTWVRRISIRTRLLLVYIGILVVGFTALIATAGQQLSAAAADDYEQRVVETAELTARGLSPLLDAYLDGRTTETEVNEALANYEAQSGAAIEIFLYEDPTGRFSSIDTAEVRGGQGPNRGDPEGEGTLQRRDADGTDTYYATASIDFDRAPRGILTLSIPATHLQSTILQRWIGLLEIGVSLTVVAVVATWWLARSLTEPLQQLRTSAVTLAGGDLQHRVTYQGNDEIGEVAHAFNHMAQQVESMVEEQRAFASNASHELRTPLTSMRLRTEALRDDDTLDAATATQYIAEIDDEVVRLSHLVQDLTLLSRFDAGRAALGGDEIDMRRFAASLQHQLQPALTEKQMQLTVTAPDEPLLLTASLSHLTVVFRNLLENALKYTPDGGTIDWTIRLTANGVESVIRDNGHGIDAADLPHIFERFYRVDKARSRDVPGTGLGLALVQSIIRAYGGTVTITSEGLEKGTSATVVLPFSSPIPPTDSF